MQQHQFTGMTRTVSVDVRGLPRPQGSMRLHTLPGGKTAARYPAAVYAWRAQVQQAVAELEVEPFAGAVELHLGFSLPRPAAHYGTGRNASLLKPGAPAHPAVMPDLDKLVRCVCDAVTDAGAWKDDSQVCVIHAAKRYASPPGVHITITELT
ncbi:MAG TPA: RusA family crossover junction endodeoxyribonuclease [Acidimicrobiales bacterium]